jgi:hypothetical protein
MNGVLTFTQWTRSTRLNENVKAAKSFLIKRYAKKNKIEEITPEVEQKALAVDQHAYNKIREILKGNDGYVYAFVKFHFDHFATYSDLEELYATIKSNAGSLNLLPMSIEEYSNQESINGVNPFESLQDEFRKINSRRAYKWVIDGVNGTLRRAIKQSFDINQLDRLYAAAKLIDDADEKAGLLPNAETSNRRTLLIATKRYSNPIEYLGYVESSADGVSDTDISEKINAIRLIQPQAGILYYGNKRLVMSVRTETAQKELCKNVSLWCINNNKWSDYAGKHPDALQINIYDFNYQPTDNMFTTGTTIDENNRVYSSSNKSNDRIIKSSNPREHFSALGYPEDLVNAIMLNIPQEKKIKNIVTTLGIDATDPSDLLITLVKSTYNLNLDTEPEIQNIIIGIIKNKLSNKLSREEVIRLYMKFGVLSTFSARILNSVLPNLTDEERTKLLEVTDKILNDPRVGFRAILSRSGRGEYPQLAKVLDSEEQIKDIIASGEAMTSDGF